MAQNHAAMKNSSLPTLLPKIMELQVSRMAHHVKLRIVTLFFCLNALIVFGLSFTLSAYSDDQLNPDQAFFTFDQKVSLVGRSYPIGIQAWYTGGLDFLSWGDPHTWKYGYFRAALNAASSGVVDRIGFEFQYFPLSIIGLSAGYDWGGRWYQPHFIDCSVYDCQGRLDSAYLKLQFAAAAHSLIVSGFIKYEELKHIGGLPQFYDESTLLPGQSRGEDVLTTNPTLLYSLSDRLNLGMTLLYSHGITSQSFSSLWGPVAQYHFGKDAPGVANSQVVFGLGEDQSTLVSPGFTLFAVWTMVIDPSLSIVDLKMR